MKTIVLHTGVYTELPQVASGIAEMSVAAKLEFPALLVRGDPVQQFADLVAGEQRPIQHAHFAMQPHPWRLVWFQKQLLGALLSREEEQILQVVHPSHAPYCRAPREGLQPGLALVVLGDGELTGEGSRRVSNRLVKGFAGDRGRCIVS